jgi:hypothetical protein
MRIISTQTGLSVAFIDKYILRKPGCWSIGDRCYGGDDVDDMDEEVVGRFQPQYRNREKAES